MVSFGCCNYSVCICCNCFMYMCSMVLYIVLYVVVVVTLTWKNGFAECVEFKLRIKNE